VETREQGDVPEAKTTANIGTAPPHWAKQQPDTSLIKQNLNC